MSVLAMQDETPCSWVCQLGSTGARDIALDENQARRIQRGLYADLY